MILLEMLSYPFLVRAFVVGVLVSLCAALLGTSLVLKRFSMIGDGLSHVGFGALAIASVMNYIISYDQSFLKEDIQRIQQKQSF